MSEQTTEISYTSCNHGISAGDIVVLNSELGRIRTLKKLFTRPRHNVVMKVTNGMFTLGEVRMTWNEWFRGILRAIIYGV